MRRFVDKEVWPLNKGQVKKIISYSNSLKVIKHDDKVKKESYCKKPAAYLAAAIAPQSFLVAAFSLNVNLT